MDTASVEQLVTIMRIPTLAGQVLMLAVGLAGIAAAVMVGMTRSDAFEAAGRQSKGAWLGILVIASIAAALGLPFIAWIGAVAIGIYYFDVRPQIADILNGNGGW